jgi:hypothetical protein
MALHELAANVIKHGALSVPWGCVAIAYETDPDDRARVIEWVQRDRPRFTVCPRGGASACGCWSAGWRRRRTCASNPRVCAARSAYRRLPQGVRRVRPEDIRERTYRAIAVARHRPVVA